MPATQERILTRHERRVKWAVNLSWYMVEPLCVIFWLGMFGGIVFVAYVEFTADNSPEKCFDVINNCEVLDVSYSYNNASANQELCIDEFLYIWKLPDSAVTFQQMEVRRRAAGDCLLELDISKTNASFNIGTARCYRVKPLFEYYYKSFNCAPTFRRNNGTASPCQTLFKPVSTYDSSVTFGVAIFVEFCMLCQAVITFPEKFGVQQEVELHPHMHPQWQCFHPPT